MRFITALLAFLGLADAPAPHMPPPEPQTYEVREMALADEKAVFATVESTSVVPARTRIGGTIVRLTVKQGDRVDEGQVIASVGDEKLALQENAFSAQVGVAKAQMAQAKIDLDRAENLLKVGGISRAAYDQTKTAYNVAANNVRSIQAQRSVVAQQTKEGSVLAPKAGRVITVPVTAGTVVLQGDTVATIAEQNFVLRLQVPERHARFLKAGDPVRLDGVDLGLDGPKDGTIKLVYPEISNGRVIADATVEGLSDYFVGERVRVWVSAGEREAIVVPQKLIVTRSGIDYVRLYRKGAAALDIPVQRGTVQPLPGMADGIEILSGLEPGDRLLAP